MFLILKSLEIFERRPWKNTLNTLNPEFPLNIVNQAKERSVIVETNKGTGSGVLIDSIHILTAKHVVRNAKKIKINWKNKTFSAVDILVDRFKNVDLAILKVLDKQFPISRSSQAKIVNKDLAIFGFNTILSKTKIFPYSGIVIDPTATEPLENRRENDDWPCQGSYILSKMNKPVINGMSGSGVYNRYGNLVGILVGSVREILNGSIWRSYYGIIVPTKFLYK